MIEALINQFLWKNFPSCPTVHHCSQLVSAHHRLSENIELVNQPLINNEYDLALRKYQVCSIKYYRIE